MQLRCPTMLCVCRSAARAGPSGVVIRSEAMILWVESHKIPNLSTNEDREMPDTPLDTVRAEFFKALAHPVRLRILRLLRRGERSVTELQESLRMESSSTSQQLTALRVRNLVSARKEGTRVLYTVTDPQIFEVLDSAKQILDKQLADGRARLDELTREEETLMQAGDMPQPGA